MLKDILPLLLNAFLETTYMVLASALTAALFGLPIGVVLATTGRGHILENAPVNVGLGAVVNATRSVPFIILLVAIIPFTRLLVGTSIGTNAAIVPLSLSAIPFVARVVETALKEVDFGVVEAAQAMGATPWAIVWKVLLPESMAAIVQGLTLTVVSLIGYSAMAGAVGGGGLGDLAIRFGYQRFRVDVMLITVVVLVAEVQLLQTCGEAIARRLNKK